MAKVNPQSIQFQSSLIVVYSLSSTALTLFIYALSVRNYDLRNLSSGILVLSISWYAVNIIDFGMSTFAVQEVVAKRRELADFYYIALLKILCFIGVILMLGAICRYDSRSLFYGSVICASLFLIQQINISFRVAGRTSSPGLFTLVEKFSSLSILILSIYLDWKLQFLQVCTFGVLVSLVAATMFSQVRFNRVSLYEIIHLLMKSSSLGVSSLIGQVKLLDANFLSFMIGPVASAPYILVSRWAGSLNLFSNAFSQAILPIFARNKLSKNGLEESKKAALWLVLGLTSSVVIFLYSPVIVQIILGDEFVESVTILRFLSLAAILTTLIQPLTVFIQTQSKAVFVTLSLFLGLITQLLIIFWFSDLSGASSAAFGYLCGQILSFLVLLLLALPFRKFFKIEV